MQNGSARALVAWRIASTTAPTAPAPSQSHSFPPYQNKLTNQTREKIAHTTSKNTSTSGIKYSHLHPSRRATSRHVGFHHRIEPSASAGISDGESSNRLCSGIGGGNAGGGNEFSSHVPCPMSHVPI